MFMRCHIKKAAKPLQNVEVILHDPLTSRTEIQQLQTWWLLICSSWYNCSWFWCFMYPLVLTSMLRVVF